MQMHRTNSACCGSHIINLVEGLGQTSRILNRNAWLPKRSTLGTTQARRSGAQEYLLFYTYTANLPSM